MAYKPVSSLGNAEETPGCLGGITPTVIGKTICAPALASSGARHLANPSVMSPALYGDPQEVLRHPKKQWWAMRFAALSLGMSLWALRAPVACVDFSAEEETAPQRCAVDGADVPAVGSNFHLLPTCVRSCSHTHYVLFLCSLIASLLLQALLVLPTLCNCGDSFMRVSWRVDFTDDIAEIRSQLDGPGGSWLWRRVQAWTGESAESLFEWLASAAQKNSRTLPLPSWSVASVSQALLGFAILQLVIQGVVLLPEPSRYQVSFECTAYDDGAPVRIRAPFDFSWLEIVGIGASIILLAIALALHSQAEWLTHCQASMEDVQSIIFTGELGEKRAAILCPVNKHPVLSQVRGMELVHVSVDGEALPFCPSGLIMTLQRQHVESYETLDLHFKTLWPEVGAIKQQRLTRVGLAALGALLLHASSVSCWSCINGVHIDDAASVFYVETTAALLGSCGRSVGTGVPSLLAALCLVTVSLAQAVMASAGNPDTPCGEDQLAITLLDFREYQENLLTNVYKGKKVRSHVWVQPLSKGKWEVAQFTRENVMQRYLWRRSEGVLHDVRIARSPSGERWKYINVEGLPASEGPPCVFIEFALEDPDGTRRHERQVVPADFLPGSFVCSVNLGRVAAWSSLSIVFGCIAMFLGLFDIVVYLIQFNLGRTFLGGCQDILSGRCLALADTAGLEVNAAVGFYFACAGCICTAATLASLSRDVL